MNVACLLLLVCVVHTQSLFGGAGSSVFIGARQFVVSSVKRDPASGCGSPSPTCDADLMRSQVSLSKDGSLASGFIAASSSIWCVFGFGLFFS
jgi:hypothetical protein